MVWGGVVGGVGAVIWFLLTQWVFTRLYPVKRRHLQKVSPSALHSEESMMTTIDSLLPTPNVLLQIFGHLEYRDIVSVGRTCKQWHHLSQDELLLRKIASRDFTPETWPHRNDTLVPYLNISSTGPTADRHSCVLGLYALVPGTRHGGKPVYLPADGRRTFYIQGPVQ